MPYTEEKTKEELIKAMLRLRKTCGLTDEELLARLLEATKAENIKMLTQLLNLMGEEPEK